MNTKKIIAKHHNISHSPLKMRVVTNHVKQLPIDEARTVLKLSRKKAARFVLKVLDAAVANAENNFGLGKETLSIAEIQVGRGRIYRHPKYRARGRMDIMRTQYSNLRVVLEGKTQGAGTKKKEQVEKKENDKGKVVKTGSAVEKVEVKKTTKKTSKKKTKVTKKAVK